jgi:hypothetical protein
LDKVKLILLDVPEQTLLFPEMVRTGLGLIVNITVTEVSQAVTPLVTIHLKLNEAGVEFNPETVIALVATPAKLAPFTKEFHVEVAEFNCCQS